MGARGPPKIRGYLRQKDHRVPKPKQKTELKENPNPEKVTLVQYRFYDLT